MSQFSSFTIRRSTEGFVVSVGERTWLLVDPTVLISNLITDGLLRSKDGLPLLTELNSLQLGTQIQIPYSCSTFRLITNLQKTVKNDTQTGATSTTLTFQSEPSQGGGSGNIEVHRLTLDEYEQLLGRHAMQLAGSYPDNNPKTAVGAKKIPLEYVPPSAIHSLARAFADGARKYGPFNWREKTISSTVYYGAALRHLMAWYDGEDNASDSSLSHLDHALACIAMIIDGASVGKLNDNRPPKGAAGRMQLDWLNGNQKDGPTTP